MNMRQEHPLTNKYGIAIDLGSTTIELSVMDLLSDIEISTVSLPNPQRKCGADIISRIRYCQSNKAHLNELCELTRHTIQDLFRSNYNGDINDVTHMTVSGNTTMLHLLRNQSVDGLSASPFCPVTTAFSTEQCWFHPDITVVYPPSFSAFVGGDIVSGAYALSMGNQSNYDLLVDLGTNGELLLLNNERGFATSTACGPVFDHAIGGARYGSDCIKAIANLRKRNLIDSQGLLKEPFFEKGIQLDKGFVIKQEHIRNFQLAKGAIYAGIICLIEKAGISYDQIQNVYICGGFGFYMDIRDAFTTKMIPEPLRDKIHIMGNTSMEGAKKMLQTIHNDNDDLTNLKNNLQNIVNNTSSFELANHNYFQSTFLDALNF